MKPFVFVLMPFDKSFNDIYKLGIKAACDEAGAYCERVDEQQFEERILDRIYNQIGKADVIISDMSGRNPNVFYETGFAHALQRRVILITKDETDIPFDLKHHPHIIYEGSISNLKDALIKRIKYFIDNPSEKKLPTNNDLKVFIKGQELLENVIIEIEKTDVIDHDIAHDFYANYGIAIRFDIHNSGSMLNNFLLQMGIITNGNFPFNENEETLIIKQENGCYLHLLNKKIDVLFPESWTYVEFRPWGDNKTLPKSTEFTLRIFNEFGKRDIPFTVNIPFELKRIGF